MVNIPQLPSHQFIFLTQNKAFTAFLQVPCPARRTRALSVCFHSRLRPAVLNTTSARQQAREGHGVPLQSKRISSTPPGGNFSLSLLLPIYLYFSTRFQYFCIFLYYCPNVTYYRYCNLDTCKEVQTIAEATEQIEKRGESQKLNKKHHSPLFPKTK